MNLKLWNKIKTINSETLKIIVNYWNFQDIKRAKPRAIRKLCLLHFKRRKNKRKLIQSVFKASRTDECWKFVHLMVGTTWFSGKIAINLKQTIGVRLLKCMCAFIKMSVRSSKCSRISFQLKTDLNNFIQLQFRRF